MEERGIAMVPTLVLLSDREQALIATLRDAIDNPDNYSTGTQLIADSTKKLMFRIGQPRYSNNPEPGVWELVIRRKP